MIKYTLAKDFIGHEKGSTIEYVPQMGLFKVNNDTQKRIHKDIVEALPQIFMAEENQEDWMERIIRDYRVFCYEMGGEEAMRKAILKNMPKPKKVEENDIRDFVMGQSMSREQSEAITSFLKAFELLDK